MLKAGTAVNARLPNGEAALNLACQNGHLECTKVLLSAGADVELAMDNGSTSLMKAAQNGHDHVARELLVAKADPNKANAKGFVALMHACQNGHLEVSFRSNHSPSPLSPNPMLTAVCLEQVARELLKAGANVDYAKADGWTAMFFACQNGHHEVSFPAPPHPQPFRSAPN